jgi:glycosyltransferase involved in cell wall biosynthesis
VAQADILAAQAQTQALVAGGPEVSVVVPVYNEEANIPELGDKLISALNAVGVSWEAVLVNDGSTDKSAELLDRLADSDGRFTIVHFRRNFGQTAAIAAGIRSTRGKIVIPMDGDLQNDPADIKRLLDKLNEGYDCVSGWREKRQDPLTKTLPSRFANAVISFVTGVHLHDYGCSLKAYRREVIQDVFLYGEMHRFIPVYAYMRGAKVGEIPVTHHPRRKGKSNYGLERILKVLLDLLVVKFFLSFQNKPIYLFGGLGLLCMLSSFVAAAFSVMYKLIPPGSMLGPFGHKDFVETPLPLLALTLAPLGVIMLLQGVLAEMVMRTYYESQGKDAYTIQRIKRKDSGAQN